MKRKSLIAATGLAAIVGVSSIVASPPQPVAAAGFMDNSFKNLTGNSSINNDIKGGIKMIAAFVYWIPVLVLVGTIAGVAIASHNQSDTGIRSVFMVGVVLMIIIGLLWLYDSKMVGTVTKALPRPFQVAILETAKAMG